MLSSLLHLFIQIKGITLKLSLAQKNLQNGVISRFAILHSFF